MELIPSTKLGLVPGKLYKTCRDTTWLPPVYKDLDGSTWLLDSANEVTVGPGAVVMYIAPATYAEQSCAVILVGENLVMICDWALDTI